MRDIKRILFMVDGGVDPIQDIKSILEDGGAERGYIVEEYPSDGCEIVMKLKKE